MDDAALLRHYLALGAPDARRWNLSPESLFLEYVTRTRLAAWVTPRPGLAVCNIGIGVGEHDDWLGYWLEAPITSVEIDPQIAATFAYRQRREGHPFPARVIAADVRTVTGAFDLVTAVGSTLAEIGDGALAACLRLVRPGGALFVAQLVDGGVALGDVERRELHDGFELALVRRAA